MVNVNPSTVHTCIYTSSCNFRKLRKKNGDNLPHVSHLCLNTCKEMPSHSLSMGLESMTSLHSHQYYMHAPTFTGCFLVIQYDACSNVATSGTVTGRYMENITQRSHMLCIRQPTDTSANGSPLPRTLWNAASMIAASTHPYDLEFF